MNAFILVAGVLLSGSLDGAQSAEPAPPGIGVRMTIAGPAFVDEHGMTLYQINEAGGGREYRCSDRPETVRPLEAVGYNQVEEFPMTMPDAASRRSCAEKYPPLLAPTAAKPIGHWTIHQRENGARQWAYRGKPLHRSIKDQVPGEIHGWMPSDRNIQGTGWGIAAAPLAAPPGIQTRVTSLGLVLSDHQGKALYYAAGDAPKTRNGDWKPLLAPAVANSEHLSKGWSIADLEGGLRQWAWQAKPLYTYVRDAGDLKAADEPPTQFVDVFGDLYGKPLPGWQAALLAPASAPPSGVQVKSIYPHFGSTTKIYADAQGHTLYAIHCAELSSERLDCDDIGDSPRYWLSFCGGEERCRRDWRALVAPRDARPIDGLWSVLIINGAHPFKPLREGGQGLAVWAYRGRPVFTFAEDQSPDDTHGEFDFFSTVMTALPIYAFSAP